MIKRKNSKKSRKGQMMELPFQLIFSIILIAVFIYSAIYGIRYFLERSEQVQAVQFLADLKSKVNLAWQATEKSEVYAFSLPKKIEKVCFADLKALRFNSTICPGFEMYRDRARMAGSNVFFCPPEGAYKIGAPVHYKMDCEGTPCLEFTKQPYCIENTGSVKIRLEKLFGKANVRLS